MGVDPTVAAAVLGLVVLAVALWASGAFKGSGGGGAKSLAKKAKAAEAAEADVGIYYGTETGTASMFAKKTAKAVASRYGGRVAATPVDFEDLQDDEAIPVLGKERVALILQSSFHIGDCAGGGSNVNYVLENAEKGALKGLTVAFFGLGDKSFEIFNGGCKKMRRAMVDRCGAKELLEPTYGDTGGDNPSGKGDSIVSLDECHDRWVESVLPKLDALLGIKA